MVLDFIYITNVVEPLNKGYFILFYFIWKMSELANKGNIAG
jgi:hypothetical protein